MPALIVEATESTLPEQKKSLKFWEKRNNLAEQKKTKKAKKQTLKSTNPSDTDINTLIQQYQAGRYGNAEKLAASLTKRFPNHQFGWKVLGVILQQTGRIRESLVPNQKAAALFPQDAEAHSNLGITLQGLGRLNEAEASLRQAIALIPDCAEAHYNLGIMLQELGRLDEAEASYRQATALKPGYVEANNNLGNTLQELGRLDEAEASLRQAIALKLDHTAAHSNLGKTLLMNGQHREGLNEILLGDGFISFDLKNGLCIL